jgi:aspartyl-tRNA(Asn)/glutamyl-tRNA(Gln) amidotransferase subunit B
VALLQSVATGQLTQTSAKQVLSAMFESGRPPAEIIAERGLGQISDQAQLQAIAERVVAENPGPVAEYLAGKEAVLRFLLGQVMRATRGQANPQLAQEILQRALEARRS